MAGGQHMSEHPGVMGGDYTGTGGESQGGSWEKSQSDEYDSHVHGSVTVIN